MKQIFSQLFYEVEKRRDTVLVTLIADRGSAPRKAGAQMLVGAEGRLVGTIGGGAVEGRSIQLCRELLDQRRSCIREFPLHQAPERDIGMVFQSYAVWPHMTVAENVAYPLKIKNVPKDCRTYDEG